MADAFRNVNLKENVAFPLTYFVIGLVGSIFGEEIHYRGYLQSSMHGVPGRRDWVTPGCQ